VGKRTIQTEGTDEVSLKTHLAPERRELSPEVVGEKGEKTGG